MAHTFRIYSWVNLEHILAWNMYLKMTFSISIEAVKVAILQCKKQSFIREVLLPTKYHYASLTLVGCRNKFCIFSTIRSGTCFTLYNTFIEGRGQYHYIFYYHVLMQDQYLPCASSRWYYTRRVSYKRTSKPRLQFGFDHGIIVCIQGSVEHSRLFNLNSIYYILYFIIGKALCR